MHATILRRSRGARSAIVLALSLAIVALGAVASPMWAAEPSASPAPAASPAASETPETMCDSLADLRLYVGFLREQSIREDGIVPVAVGTIASLTEARRLATLVGATYRPLVEDLVGALDDLRTAVRGFREAGTVGTGLVGVGEAIAEVGVRMDVLSVALSEPCPPASSPAPEASPAA